MHELVSDLVDGHRAVRRVPGQDLDRLGEHVAQEGLADDGSNRLREQYGGLTPGDESQGEGKAGELAHGNRRVLQINAGDGMRMNLAKAIDLGQLIGLIRKQPDGFEVASESRQTAGVVTHCQEVIIRR